VQMIGQMIAPPAQVMLLVRPKVQISTISDDQCRLYEQVNSFGKRCAFCSDKRCSPRWRRAL
jgi:hypothetical protein